MIRPVAVALALVLAACAGAHRQDGSPEVVTLEGSDTMAMLAARWAEAYMAHHDGVVIEVTSGGTGTGIAALAHGTATIADASRPLTNEERALVLAARGVSPVTQQVALDAIAVYVNARNPLRQLDVTRLGAVFRGETTRWSALGGEDRPIVRYGRGGGSGTRAWMATHVLAGGDFAANVQALPGTAAVVDAVAHDPGGIGYGGIAYVQDVRALAIAGADGVPRLPTQELAVSGAYPLTRSLYLVTAGPPAGAAAGFLRWVVSPEGQRLVSTVGYYPVPGGPRAAE